VFPVRVTANAVAYAIADRTKGAAVEDKRFGQLAKWRGLISEEEYDEALERQGAIAESGRPAPDIGSILVSKGLLTNEQVDGILYVFGLGRPTNSDFEFGECVREHRFISREDHEAAQREQKKLEQTRYNAPPLPYILLDKRLITEQRVAAVLELLRRAGLGILGEYDRAMGDVPTTEKKPLPKKLIACSCLVLLIFSIWGGKTIRDRMTPKVWIALGCKQCKNMDVWEISSRQKLPMECPWCHKTKAFSVFACKHCGKLRFETSLDDFPICPHCDKGRGQRLYHSHDTETGEWLIERYRTDQ